LTHIKVSIGAGLLKIKDIVYNYRKAENYSTK